MKVSNVEYDQHPQLLLPLPIFVSPGYTDLLRVPPAIPASRSRSPAVRYCLF